MKAYHYLIKGPIITEKTHALREAANKIEIRKAIEDIFKVKVLGVNTIHFKGKKKKMGKTMGVRPDWKKAVVTLAPGEKIAGFEAL